MNKVYTFGLVLRFDWLFISEHFYCSFVYIKGFLRQRFSVDQKAMPYETNNQTTEIKEAIHINFLTFSPLSNNCVQILLWIWELDWDRSEGYSAFSHVGLSNCHFEYETPNAIHNGSYNHFHFKDTSEQDQR